MIALPEGWEDASCAVCGEGAGHVFLRARDLNWHVDEVLFRLVRCPSCGLTYVSPRPTRDRIGRFYPPDYAPHQEVQGFEGRVLGRRSKRFQPVRAMEPGRYLDVGCGSGGALLRMKVGGWDVAGFEVSEQAARAGRAGGLDIRTGRELADAAFEARSFDLVTLFCVLPHLHDPQAVLAEVARILRPGGVLLMTMPNLRSLNFMLFRQRWYHLDPPRHLHFFLPGNLRELAARAGFVPEGRRFRSGGGGFKNSLRLSRSDLPWARLFEDLLRLRPMRWLSRFFFRYGVDAARLGDTVDWWWRRV